MEVNFYTFYKEKEGTGELKGRRQTDPKKSRMGASVSFQICCTVLWKVFDTPKVSLEALSMEGDFISDGSFHTRASLFISESSWHSVYVKMC